MISTDEKDSIKLKGMSMYVKIHTSNSTLKFKSSIYFYYLVQCGGFLLVSSRPNRGSWTHDITLHPIILGGGSASFSIGVCAVQSSNGTKLKGVSDLFGSWAGFPIKYWMVIATIICNRESPGGWRKQQWWRPLIYK